MVGSDHTLRMYMSVRYGGIVGLAEGIIDDNTVLFKNIVSALKVRNGKTKFVRNSAHVIS